jgi:hypothetical protein
MCFRRKIKEVNPNLDINSKEIVVYQKFKKGRIFLKTPIKIPRNFAFAVTKNRNVLDVLNEGKTTLEIKMLPETTKKLALYKTNKRGRSPKYFEADTYFINMNTFENFKWETAGYVELEERPYGLYKASCYGDINFKIQNPNKLLTYLLSIEELITSISAESILKNYINERATRIIDKANPSAKDLYLKNKEILKLLYEKLSDWLNEIGIELNEITLTESKFPPKILADLRNIGEVPVGISGWGKMSFEDWQAANPSTKNSKPKFVTIIPTGKTGHFFKESMAPYFFEDEENKEDEGTNKKSERSVEVETVWKGIDEKIAEEESKKLVNLDDLDSKN